MRVGILSSFILFIYKLSLDSMQITLNGKAYMVDQDATIEKLAQTLNIAPSQVAIERNREIVPRSQYGSIVLNEGDQVEIVTFIGGG
jgi:thiamine biosynthesis protein ThiS